MGKYSTFSQSAVYADLRKQPGYPKRTSKKKERKNSKRSRAHRLNQFLSTAEQVVATTREHLTPQLVARKIAAIRNILNVHDHGLITDENLILVLADILKE
jgi:hypothetical protein